MTTTIATGPATADLPHAETVEPLREQVRGQVITAADEGYDEARTVHNGMFDKRRSQS